MKLDLLYEIDAPRPWGDKPHPYAQRDREQRAYREMLFTAPGARESISGAIFYDETLRQKTKERRYLQAFRQRNYEFLQRYASLKQRIKAVLDKGKK